MTTDWFDANRRNWNERARVHASSRTYNLDAFRADEMHLSDVVLFDRPYLGELTGLEAVHLQCHIGTDTLSLARLGARVTGVDQSEVSIAVARQLFDDTETVGRFEVGNVYDAPALLNHRYDLVYTGVGALNWLPDINAWAETVVALLKPAGRLYLREGHPMLQSLDDTTDGTLRVRYPYFQTPDPMVFDTSETYTEQAEALENTRTYEWNHGLGEVLMALLNRGLRLHTLDEHDGLEWQMFPHMVRESGQFKLPAAQRAMVPMMYTLIAERSVDD